MNKYEYLAELRNRLSSLPKTEQDEAIKHYRDMFNSAGRANEQSVIRHLGTPKILAGKILNTGGNLASVLDATRKEFRKASGQLSEHQRKISILVIILLFPVWGTVVLGVLAAIVILFLGTAALLIFAMAAGVALVCMGIVHMIESVSIGFVHIGIGLILIGAVLLLFMPAMNLIFWLLRQIIIGGADIFYKITKKAEVWK